MINLRILGTLLALSCLLSCDDKRAEPTTQQQQGQEIKNAQSLQGIDLLLTRLDTNPDDFVALSALGDMYFESGQYVDAFNTYDKAIAINPMCADCFNDRGLALFYLGDATSALESFDKAIAVDPEYTHAWLSKGFVLTSERRFKEAVVPLNKVKELDTTGALAQQADKFLALGAGNNFQ